MKITGEMLAQAITHIMTRSTLKPTSAAANEELAHYLTGLTSPESLSYHLIYSDDEGAVVVAKDIPTLLKLVEKHTREDIDCMVYVYLKGDEEEEIGYGVYRCKQRGTPLTVIEEYGAGFGLAQTVNGHHFETNLRRGIAQRRRQQEQMDRLLQSQ
jgi:hypothetical protein